jgi:hypothetical protein
MADGGQRRVVPRRHDVTPRVAAVRAVQSRVRVPTLFMLRT